MIYMKFPDNSDIRQVKLDALKEKILRLNINLPDIEETFTRGSGKGGQKINKTANKVNLYYPPLNIRVTCQKERKLSLNRFLALRELVDEIELIVSPQTSEKLATINKIRKRKGAKPLKTLNKQDLV